MIWPVRRTLAQRLFGIRRSSRRLRHALETYAAEAARARELAREPADAAHHAGRRAAYVAALGELAGATRTSEPPSPPDDVALARAWRRGHATAAEHAQRLLDEMV